MCDEAKIDELVKAAVLAELDGVEFLQGFDYATLCREYNGVGPDRWPAAVRDRLSGWLSLFLPAVLIHDLRNSASDGSRNGFTYANLEFLENCLRLADYRYPWYSWRRYRARAAAHVLYECVRSDDGWQSWRESAEKNGVIPTLAKGAK